MGRRKGRRGARDAPPERTTAAHEQAPAKPFNNPFGALSGIREDLASTPDPVVPAVVDPGPAPRGRSWGRLVVSAEKKGRRGKTVTRIKGLPGLEVVALARELKTALGCGATFEGDDLILLGAVVDRAGSWLEARGATGIVVAGGRPATKRGARATDDPRERPPGSRDLAAGLTVDVVLKKDQPSGALTRGVVKDILTRSAAHPHGIKVRLHDGAVGRVKRIILPSTR